MPPELSSLSETWLAENWLLSAGVVPDSSIDTLLLYGYSQPGVAKVKLEIDKDEDNGGKNPKISFRVKLNPKAGIKFRAFNAALKIKNPILKKIAMLAAAKAGAPIGIDKVIKDHAVDYLPPQYSVDVEIVDE